jgi:hypothetical protein
LVLFPKQPLLDTQESVTKFNWLHQFVQILYLLWNNTRVSHCSISWATGIQSTPSHSIPLKSTMILFCYLHLSPPSTKSCFPSGIPTTILCSFRLSHMCYMPCPSHPPCFDHCDNIMWKVK